VVRLKTTWYYVILVAMIVIALVLGWGPPQITTFASNLYDTTSTTVWNWVGVAIIIALAIVALYQFGRKKAPRT
jgi:uncharacterized BrkB/YihY/UPF0761 family membrane protein